MLTLLVCPNCGGPLPTIAATAPYVTCEFCGSTSSISDKTIIERHDGDAMPPPKGERERAAWLAVTDPEYRVQLWKGFLEVLTAEAGGRPISYATLRECARQQLGFFGDGEVIARVTYKLALEFGREQRLEVRTAECLARLGQGYVEAINTLRKSAKAEINVPFFMTARSGPVHYLRTITASEIAALAESDPPEPTPKADPKPDPKPDEAKRGFFSKLFG